MRDKYLGVPSIVRSPHPNSNPNHAHNTPQREEEKAHRAHLHQHNLFHNKRQTATAIDVQSVITEVVQTLSYLQQIDVDPNGSTFSIQTLLALPTAGEYVSSTTDTSAAMTTQSASPGTSNTASSASSTVVGLPLPNTPSSTTTATQSLLTNQSTTSTSSSLSSIPTTSSFASFTISSNTTTLISSQSTFVPSFSNSTITSSLSSAPSFTYLSPLSSSSSSSSGLSTSTSSFYSPSYSSSSSTATSTGDGGIIATGGTVAATGSSSTSTAAAGNGTNSGSSSGASTSTVVGSVVGSVAGAAILIVILMMFLRWKKRHQNMLSLGSGDPGPGAGTTRDIGPAPSQPTGGMSGPQSSLFAVPGALTSLTGFKRSSRPANQIPPTEAGGERGFYRVSGRKLPSVLQTGGNGYGDEMINSTLSGSSFYRDSEGFYGGPGSPTLVAPLRSPRPESGLPVMRPSPARTPVTEHGPFAFPNSPGPLTPPLRPDVLGRSHPSHDGSHTSRFTEEV